MTHKKPLAIIALMCLLAGFLQAQSQDNSWLMYNYITEEFEEIVLDTIKNFEPYIPQIPAAINLYRLYVEEMGYEPVEAAYEIMRAIAGDSIKPKIRKQKTS